MLDSIGQRLTAIFKNLRSRGKLTESDVSEAMREVQRALLEADVSLPVVKDFVARVKEKAIGEDVWKSLTPGQLVIKYVRDELVELMGGQNEKIHLASQPPTVIMMVGLHGQGKTTSTGKLARLLKEQGRKPLLVACDVYRPAAVTQLQVLGRQLDIPVYAEEGSQNPVEIARHALEHAERTARDVIFVDTAGRLHVDDGLMTELKELRAAVNPHETLLVVDAMTGQDAVNVAKAFNDAVGVDGVVLTKFDGDARGGAALSVKAVTGKPIKYIGTGEKLTALEPFHPDRLVGRMLGMGDVLTMIEKAEQTMSAEQAEELERKLRSQDFDLQDFMEQLEQVRKMGPLQELLGMLPGFSNAAALKDLQVDERQFSRITAIIKSMTPKERRNPDLLNASRKRRVASGSGTQVEDVNRLLKQFDMTKQMMKRLTGGAGPFGGGGKKKPKKRMKLQLPFGW
ncbi:MAG: signal recognition particle protein [Proteobacteria bacterium]|nr:signal recognition particle protein [Pseudomonadota bacterium]